jgi:hypothetical protein
LLYVARATGREGIDAQRFAAAGGQREPWAVEGLWKLEAERSGRVIFKAVEKRTRFIQLRVKNRVKLRNSPFSIHLISEMISSRWRIGDAFIRPSMFLQ